MNADVNVASLDVTVNNVAPIDNAGADQTVNEGDLVTLNGSFTDAGVDDGHKQEWSIIASNGQIITGLIIDNLTGASDGAGGRSFSFTPADNGTSTVSYKVTDDDGGVQTDTAIITVTNVIPFISGLSVDSAVIDENGSVTISGSVTDVGTLDTHTVQINWGNGEVSSAALVIQGNGSGTFTATHQYLDDNPTNSLSDAYTITATVTDDDGGTVTRTAQAIITGAGVTNGILYVIGTDRSDHVTINLANGSYKVHSDFYPSGAPLKTFNETGVTEIVVVMSDGDDQVQVAGNITTPTLIDGGRGDDKLNGGAGNNIIIGGAGNDKLLGGSGRDLLIGGDGADDLVGNSGEDLLIGEWTVYDTNYVALRAIVTEWSRTDSVNGTYEKRRDHLRGTAAGGLNAGYLLTTGASGTVRDDNAADKQSGSSGRDLYFANLAGGLGRVLDNLVGGERDESYFDTL